MPMILSPAADGDPIVIDKAVIMIGRHPTCDVIINNNRKVSRKHCCVVQVNDKYFVRDLGSMNGIQVNGNKVKKEAPLNLGDLLTVGDVDYRFQLGAGAKKSTVAPVGVPVFLSDEPTAAGLVDKEPEAAPLMPLADEDSTGLAPLESEGVQPEVVEIVDPDVDDFEMVEPEIVDDFVEVVEPVLVEDEVVVVDEYEDVEVVDVYDESVEIVDDSVEIVDDAVEVVDDVVEVFDDVDVIEVYDDDDFEDVVLLDEDDDFFDGPVEILD